MARPTLRQILRALAATNTPLPEAEALIGAARRREKPGDDETTAERANRQRREFAEEMGLDAEYEAARREAQLERRLGWDVAPPPGLDDWDDT